VVDTGDRFADDDPEYSSDAADDVDEEGIDVEPTDATKMPEDQPDIGSAEPPGTTG
jgi:hypothetical protein